MTCSLRSIAIQLRPQMAGGQIRARICRGLGLSTLRPFVNSVNFVNFLQAVPSSFGADKPLLEPISKTLPQQDEDAGEL